MRVGIRPEHPVRDLAAYVLMQLPKADREDVLEIASEAADAVELILAEGAKKAMSKFNRRVPPDEGDAT